MVNRSQNLLRGFSIGELVLARTIGLYKVYGGRLLKSDKRYILWHRSQCFFSDSANSISGQPTLLSCQCQNVLQENHCGDNLSPWSKWFLGCMGGFGTGVILWCLLSPLAGPQLSAVLFLCCCLTAWGVVGSNLQCWHKDRLELCHFGRSFRNDKAREKYRFHIQGLSGEVTGLV